MQGEFPFDQDFGARLLIGAGGFRFWKRWIVSGRIMTLTQQFCPPQACPECF